MVIGFIGLGNMGKPIAMNMLKAGNNVFVSPAFGNEAPAKELEEQGATIVATIREVIESAETLVTILPADKQIIDVYLGADGVLECIREGAVCIEMTSSRGNTIKSVEDEAKKRGKNIRFIDAPVSGGVDAAKVGTLTIMVSGQKDVVDSYIPLLELVGKKIIYTGEELGSAKSIKMLNQMLNAGNTCVASEVIYLAQQLGIDMDILSNVVNESSGGSWVFKNNVSKFILPQNFEGGFKLELMKKDVGLAMEQAFSDNISLPIINMVHQMLTSEANLNHGSKNYNIVSNWIKRHNNPTN
ncbi:MAG TPA: NAD(P)-dependent oxidoreductase [Ruminiclostridium sp.]